MVVRYLSFVFVLVFTFSSNLYAGGLGAGVLPMFDDGTVLVGRETRFSNKLKRNVQVWSDFGGAVDSKDKGDIARTALREANEETANTLRLSYNQVVNSPYTDHHHPSGGSYRMYYVKVSGQKPSLADFHNNARKLRWKSVEKSDWKYIPAQQLLNAVNVFSYTTICPGTNEEIFAPTRAGLRQRTAQSTLYNLINSVKSKPVSPAPKPVAKKPAPVIKREGAAKRATPAVKRPVSGIRKPAPAAKRTAHGVKRKPALAAKRTAHGVKRKAAPAAKRTAHGVKRKPASVAKRSAHGVKKPVLVRKKRR
ncbi:MAG: NUDIX domain-containing protein [Alphaproteobacteria bacterium]|nr:NUDIX domain-containing protein [Alphaproteobacteria bacterium]